MQTQLLLLFTLLSFSFNTYALDTIQEVLDTKIKYDATKLTPHLGDKSDSGFKKPSILIKAAVPKKGEQKAEPEVRKTLDSIYLESDGRLRTKFTSGSFSQPISLSTDGDLMENNNIIQRSDNRYKNFRANLALLLLARQPNDETTANYIQKNYGIIIDSDSPSTAPQNTGKDNGAEHADSEIGASGLSMLTPASKGEQLLSYLANSKDWQDGMCAADGSYCEYTNKVDPNKFGILQVDNSIKLLQEELKHTGDINIKNTQQVNSTTPVPNTTQKEKTFESTWLTPEDLEKMANDLPEDKETFTLYVGAEWCPPCQQKIAAMKGNDYGKEIPDIISYDTTKGSNNVELKDINGKQLFQTDSNGNNKYFIKGSNDFALMKDNNGLTILYDNDTREIKNKIINQNGYSVYDTTNAAPRYDTKNGEIRKQIYYVRSPLLTKAFSKKTEGGEGNLNGYQIGSIPKVLTFKKVDGKWDLENPTKIEFP